MKNRYLTFFVMYFCAAALALSQFKIVPILGPITENLGIAYELTSWLMSVFTVAGIILAMPADGLIAKFGPKKVWAVVMAIMICGNVIGAIGIDSYAILLVSRILEGCAFAFVAIAGVVFVNMWFPDRNTGLFVGIFMTFISIGSIVALNRMIPLTSAYGLVSAWWMTAIVSVVMTVVFLAVVREHPPQPPRTARLPRLYICYDMCFPEVARILANKGAELLISITGWPNITGTDDASGHIEYMLFQKARAAENMVPIVCATLCGQYLEGHSMILGATAGSVIARAGYDEEMIMAELDAKQEVVNARMLSMVGTDLLRDRKPNLYGNLVEPNPFNPYYNVDPHQLG